MPRTKGSLPRREAAQTRVHRRPLMDALPPAPAQLQLQTDSSSPPPQKRPRFLYAPLRHLDPQVLLPPSKSEAEAEILVPTDHFTLSNPAIRARTLWGSGPYTDDSDVVAVAAHSGAALLPVSRPAHGADFVRLHVRLSRPEPVPQPFVPSNRHGIRSRSWGSEFQGVQLEVLAVQPASVVDGVSMPSRRPRLAEVSGNCKGLVSTLGRGVKGREDLATAHGSGKKGRREPGPLRQGMVMMFDLCDGPCVRYTLNGAGGGAGVSDTVLERLDGEVLYVENAKERFEIAKNGDSGLRFGKVKETALERELLKGVGRREDEEEKEQGRDVETEEKKAKDENEPGLCVPVKETDLHVVIDNLPWKELYWDSEGVTVKGKHYPLTKMFFRDKDED